MKTIPIYAPRNSYRGKDVRKGAKRDSYNRVASKVENYLNEQISQMPADSVRVFLSHSIAVDIDESPSLVGEIVFAIDGGSNGITCWHGDYERALGK